MSSQAELEYLNLLRGENRSVVQKLLKTRVQDSRPLSDELLQLATKWRVALDYLLMDDASTHAAAITNLLKGSWGTVPIPKEIDRLCELIINECPEAYDNWVKSTITKLREHTAYDGPIKISAVKVRLWTHDPELNQMVQQKGVIFEE